MLTRSGQPGTQVVTHQDAIATLGAIEEANRKVEELLSEGSRESASVGQLKSQLMELQVGVEAGRRAAVAAAPRAARAGLQPVLLQVHGRSPHGTAGVRKRADRL